MFRKIRRVLTMLLLLVFVGSVGVILYAQHQYHTDEQLYSQAMKQFTAVNVPRHEEDIKEETVEVPPIEVDFDALRQENEHVIGWIYCEGTVINYPVVQGSDNQYYLKHAYDGTYTTSGSIFIDCGNQPDFSDSNTIIYGHHMLNKTMFAPLGEWADQQFYEEHPFMWLLTPEQNYKIVLFSGYTTKAGSDTYAIFQGAGEELDQYIGNALAKSDFQADVELGEGERYVLLSTCAYVFNNARSVLHGKLVPV